MSCHVFGIDKRFQIWSNFRSMTFLSDFTGQQSQTKKCEKPSKNLFFMFFVWLCWPVKFDRNVVDHKLDQIWNPWSIPIAWHKYGTYLYIFRGSNWVISKKSHFPYKVIKRKWAAKPPVLSALPRGLGPWKFFRVEIFAWEFGKSHRLMLFWSYHIP